jgi:hypothetical protein
LQLKTKGQAISRGILGHLALAHFYELIQEGIPRDDAMGDALNKMHIEAYAKQDSFDMGLVMNLVMLLKEYNTYYAREDAEWEVLAVEKTFQDKTLPFTPDLIKRHRVTGEIRVVDHKFLYNFYDARVMNIAPQLPKYMQSLMNLGYTVDSNMLRHRDNAHQKFQREKIRVPQKRRETFHIEHLKTAQQIIDLKKLPLAEWEARVVRNANMWSCKTCPFLDLCQTDLDGLNGRDLLVSEFYETNTYGYKILEGEGEM